MCKTAGTSIHIFPAVDATHRNKYKSLLSRCLAGFSLLGCKKKKKNGKKVSLKIAGGYQAAAHRQKEEPVKESENKYASLIFLL